MPQDIQQQLIELEALDTAALKKLWPKYFTRPPLRIRRDYLAASLAYKIQEKAYGGLSKTIKNKLRRLAFGNQQVLVDKYALTPGMKLVREFGGRKHVVTVTEDGFEYEGKSYRTLSGIFKVIKGYMGSGPEFFGLCERSKNDKTS